MLRVDAPASRNIRLTGTVRTGAGEGAGFTGLSWARTQFIEHCGIDPYPGTLNLQLESALERRAWRTLRNGVALWVRPSDPGACAARLYPVTLSGAGGSGRMPAAIVWPQVESYPSDQLECIAPVGLRDHFDAADGSVLMAEAAESFDIRTVIFDLDGTLLNSLDGYRLAASRATEAYGYEITLAHVRHALDSGQSFWDVVIPDGEPRDPARIAELRAATMEHWPGALAEVVEVLPGAGEALEKLRAGGARLAIYTGSAGEALPALRHAGLMELFDTVVTAADVPGRKPEPDGILECLRRLGAGAAGAAYIGDSCHDIDAARAAGVMPVGVLTGAGSSASLARAGAERLCADVAHLPPLFSLA